MPDTTESDEINELVCLFWAQRLALLAAFDKMTASELRELAAELLNHDAETLGPAPPGSGVIPEGFIDRHADGGLVQLHRQARAIMNVAAGRV